MPYYITTEELTTLSVSRDMKDNVYVDNVISGCEYEPEVILFFEEEDQSYNIISVILDCLQVSCVCYEYNNRQRSQEILCINEYATTPNTNNLHKGCKTS